MAYTAPDRVLVTGASGFVGAYLLRAVAARYPQARLYTTALHAHEDTHTHGIEAHVLVADMRDPTAVRAAVQDAQPNLIFHLAGQASVVAAWADPAGTLATNAGGTIHLLEAVRTSVPTARVLLIGSSEQYGPVAPADNPISERQSQHPTNPYAVSKAAQELIGLQYMAAYGLDVVCARAFNHFGPRQLEHYVVASFARQLASIERGMAPPRLMVGNLSAQRDFLPVEDVVAAYLALAERGRSGEVYNVGSGVPHAISAVLESLIACAAIDVRVEVDSARLRPVDVPLAYADVTKLRQETGWQPTHDFTRALADVLDYWRSALQAR